jgi:hypothetical protein
MVGCGQLATPQDGAFDSAYEPFTINVALATAGSTANCFIEARATDETGYAEQTTASTEIETGGASPQFTTYIPFIVTGL